MKETVRIGIYIARNLVDSFSVEDILFNSECIHFNILTGLRKYVV